MSRAFVKDQEDAPEALPERPVSTNANFVTPRGLHQIDEKLETLRRDLAHAQHEGDRSAIALASRELRYWSQRRASAQIVEPPKQPKTHSQQPSISSAERLGRRAVGARRVTAKGSISYSSPARAEAEAHRRIRRDSWA